MREEIASVPCWRAPTGRCHTHSGVHGSPDLPVWPAADRDLRCVAEAWSRLSEHARKTIAALVDAARE